MSEGSPATGGDLSISAWFWNPDIWLPPNVTWESFQESPAERNINREASWKTYYHTAQCKRKRFNAVMEFKSKLQ